MLNISENSIDDKVNKKEFKSFSMVEDKKKKDSMLRTLIGSLIVFLGFLFLPWTQNVSFTGTVISLKPNQRPHTIHSAISGRIEEWYVNEGDYVKKGDTILHISEIKNDYLDPELVARTKEILDAKKSSVGAYNGKVSALKEQVETLKVSKELKVQQAKNYIQQAQLKVQSDSINFEALKIDFQIAEKQFKRTENLYDEGLKSLTDLENKKNKFQAAKAKMIGGENKLLTSRNALINTKVDLNAIRNEYDNKIAKASSDRFTAVSNKYEADGSVAKLENQLKNYTLRNEMYYIKAPQDGYITKAIKVGLGETIKEGEVIISIMPAQFQIAAELYVEPINVPLLEKGHEVRLMFDGWPAIVFSGWPNVSYGTFGSEIVAIDNFISDNGRYRIVVKPKDDLNLQWPKLLRVGSGAKGIALLKDVPVWYELWRQLNGFPPDFYHAEKKVTTKDKRKKK